MYHTCSLFNAQEFKNPKPNQRLLLLTCFFTSVVDLLYLLLLRRMLREGWPCMELNAVGRNQAAYDRRSLHALSSLCRQPRWKIGGGRSEVRVTSGCTRVTSGRCDFLLGRCCYQGVWGQGSPRRVQGCTRFPVRQGGECHEYDKTFGPGATSNDMFPKTTCITGNVAVLTRVYSSPVFPFSHTVQAWRPSCQQQR